MRRTIKLQFVRVGMIAELVLLIAASAIAARFLAELAGIPGPGASAGFLFGQSPPQWIEAALADTSALVLRYGPAFGAAVLLSWLGGAPDRMRAGLTRNSRPVGSLIMTGIALGFLAGAPAVALRYVHEIFVWGASTPFWDLMRQTPWDGGFWLYVAVSSFLLVPLFEELLFRGYALGRLRAAFSAGGATLISAILFWMAHGQYLRADPFLLLNSAALFAMALALAWSVLRTGSLIPAVIAHAIINIPLQPQFMLGFLGVAGLILVIRLRAVAEFCADAIRALAAMPEKKMALAITLIAAAALIAARAIPEILPVLVIAAGLTALTGLILQNRWRRPESISGA